MSEHGHFEELITLKLDGLLDAAGERELTEHLASCDDCRELYELLVGVRETLGIEPQPPEALVTGVMEGVERINRTRRSLRVRRAGIAAGVLAAAAVLALAVLPRSDSGNGETPDDGIAAYSLEGGLMETRDAIPDDPDGNQAVSLFPGTFSLPVPGNDTSLEEYCADHYAVAYFEALPEEIVESGEERVFADGTVGYEITKELLDKYAGEAVEIDHPAPGGEGVMAVQILEN